MPKTSAHAHSPAPCDQFDADPPRAPTHVVNSDWPFRPFAIFHFGDGASLEIHVPGALLVAISGPSGATEPVFIWQNEDRSIEDSGPLDLNRSFPRE